MSNLKYFVERTEGDGFNLWIKKDNTFYNLATLFYNAPVCDDDWNISELKKSVSYSQEEISDELENPLIDINIEPAERLLAMKGKSPKEIYDYLKSVLGGN